MSERGQGSCGNCKGVYFNRYKPENCTTCGFYLGGTYQPRPKKTKPNNPDCVLVADHLGTRIYSVKTHARDFRCLVIQENGIFQCLSTKCLDVRATFLNSEKPELFSCAHTPKATDAISPLKTYQLSEEVIEHYKCDDSTKDTLRSVMESSPLPSVVQVSESTFCVNGFSSATNPTGYCHVKAANDNVIVCSSQECKSFAQKTKHVRHKKICLHVHVLLCTKSQMNEEESATSTSSTTTQTQSAEVEVETVNTSRKSTIRLNMQHSIPYTIPDCILSKIIENDSKAALNMGGWPKELSPLQVQCPLCNGNLTEARIHPGKKKDDHGLLVTNGTPFRPIKIHVKHCKSPSCKAMVQVFPFEIGLFNISDKLLVSLDILLEWRELLKRGVPITVAIESKIEVLSKKCNQELSSVAYVTNLLYNGFYCFEMMTTRSMDNAICGICGVLGQIYLGDGNEKNCCSISEIDYTIPDDKEEQSPLSLEKFLLKLKELWVERASFTRLEKPFHVNAFEVPPLIAPQLRAKEIVNTEMGKKVFT